MNDSPDWQSVFSFIERTCSSYDEDSFRVQAELMADLRENNLKIDRRKFNQWVTSGILRPTSQPDRAGYPVYDLAEIKKAFLAAYLFHTYEFRPAEIKVATQIYASGRWRDPPALHLRDLNQGQRARLILTGRILGVCSALATRRRTPPQNTIIICHELPPGDCRYPSLIQERKVAEIQELLKPTENLLGWSADGPSDEVFSIMKDPKLIERRLSQRKFFSISIHLSDEDRCFAVTLGPHERTRFADTLSEMAQLKRTFTSPESEETRQIAQLLSYSFHNVTDLQNSLWQNLPHSRLHEDASLLSILVTAVLLRKPTRWSAAAFYGYTSNETIYCRAHSPNYPIDRYPPVYSLPKKSSPFSWAFSQYTHLLVNRLQANDFRLTNEISDPGVSHAFIPSIQLNNCVGVLHVIGETAEMSSEQCFTHDDVGVLYVLARVIGEAYHRNLVASVGDVCSIVPVPRITHSNEAQLRTTLADIIRAKVALAPEQTPAIQPSERYLVLFAVRAQRMDSKERQNAYFDLVRQRTSTYFRRYYIDRRGSSDCGLAFQLDDEELVIVANDLVYSEVRRVREELQLELEDISSINPAIYTQCAVWSVHLSYDYIRTNFHINGGTSASSRVRTEDAIERAVEDIMSRTKAALKVIWQVRSADAALKRRNYREAESILTDALVLDQDNSYILRHLAQARFGLSRYIGAEKAAQKAIDIDSRKNVRFASNHQRLAEAYFGQGKYREAFAEMEKACKYSRDLRYRRAFIQLLILHGEAESLQRALAMIIDAAFQIGPDDPDNLAGLEHLRGEARLRTGEIDQALEAFEKAASLSPAYHDADWDILRIKLGKESREYTQAQGGSFAEV